MEWNEVIAFPFRVAGVSGCGRGRTDFSGRAPSMLANEARVEAEGMGASVAGLDIGRGTCCHGGVVGLWEALWA
jgi:hypothetical protein